MKHLYETFRQVFLPTIEKNGLRPHSQLVTTNNKDEWLGTGPNPIFKIRFDKSRKLSGWYMLEVNISSKEGSGTAKFYFCYHEGSGGKDSIMLSYNSGQLSKRLYYFQHNPIEIHFNPLESPGKFSIGHFRVAKVTKQFAMSRMLKKLAKNHPLYRNKSFHLISKYLTKKSTLSQVTFREILYDSYNELFSHRTKSTDYQDWIDNVEKRNTLSNAEISSKIHGFSYKPIISIVLPTYNSDETLLRYCIDSVISQRYPYWELCIADDASTNPRVCNIIKEYADSDKRIKAVLRDLNRHISEATNSAISLAEGGFIAFLDHDDELSEDALFFIVESLNEHPAAKIIYSDEDKIDKQGVRSCPHMKPDWNPDLFLSQNYISHLCVIKASLVRAVGCIRKGVEGSQDYDLLLRCIPKVTDREIIHVSRVLYHWRAIETSTANSDDAKDYKTASGVKALQDYVQSTGLNCDVSPGVLPNTYILSYAIPSPVPLVSIIIPTRDNKKILRNCISSILAKTTYKNYEIVILNNQSVEIETLSYLQSLSRNPVIRVLSYDYPFNYSSINNYGVKHANGSVLCLLNDDTEVISPDWLTVMVSNALRPSIGCVGAKLLYTNGQIQHGGVVLGIGGVAGHVHRYADKDDYGYFGRLFLTQNYTVVTGACLVVKKSTYEKLGGLNEKELPVALNDVDFCLRVREAGYRNVWTPFAELYHYESISRGLDDSPMKQKRAAREVRYMKKRWGKLLTNDPAYNTNLSLTREDFTLAFPPDTKEPRLHVA
jgi:GT2 family glycosyltransferase